MKWWYENEEEEMGLEIMAYDKEKGWHYRPIKEKKMEFDKSRVYTSLNADELRAGDKVIVAETLMGLRENVENNAPVCTIKEILGEDFAERFNVDIDWNSLLAYLVERAENCTNCEGCGDYVDPRDDREKIMVCSQYKPNTETPELISLGNGQYVEKSKTEQKAEKKEMCLNCKHYNKVNDFRDCTLVNNPTGACPHYEAEKHYRPFANTDELIKVWEKKWSDKTNGQKWHDCNLNMPHIWVREKQSSQKSLITAFGHDMIYSFDAFSLNQLFEDFEFLDGSPCGVEE